MWVSGSGKSTVIDWLLQDTQIHYIPSYTTRIRRPWETVGKYMFISHAEFADSIIKHEFIEYAQSHGLWQFYGTKLVSITDTLKSWKTWIKEIEIIWRNIIKQSKIWQYCKSIRLDLPLDRMRDRILSRWHMHDHELQKRLDNALIETAYAHDHCDYHIDATMSKSDVLLAVLSCLSMPTVTSIL